MTNDTRVYEELASAVGAYWRCREHEAVGSMEWLLKHEERIEALCEEHMPHGSGFDSGTKLLLAKSTETKLTFETSFHHMNENGFYDGWTEHTVIVTPRFGNGVSVRVTGKDRNDIKEYIADMFNAISDVSLTKGQK